MTVETLMTTEAENTTQGEAASIQDEQAATAAVEVVQQQATESQIETEVKPQGAPESYEFTPVDGAAPEIVEQFSGLAKELNLTQETAQKVLSQMAPAIQAHQASQVEAITKGWAEQSTADPEFGGQRLQESLTVAKKALDTFGTPELRKLFNESGLGNHPEVIRFMVRAGKAVSEDKFVTGASAPQGGIDARNHYPASNMNP